LIDLLKILIVNTRLIQKLDNDSRLILVTNIEKLGYDRETIQTKKIKEYNGVLFCFYEYKVEILFKPHYYFNNGLHNGNDFTIIECINTIRTFVEKFEISEIEAKIINIEFGVNIISPINIKDLISFIIYHENNEFVNHSGLRFSKIATSTNKAGKWNFHKMIKAYAKGLQHPKYVDPNTFRFEVKSKRTAYIKRNLNVQTIQNLLSTEPYFRMQEIILKEFKSVLILDVDATPDLTKKEQEKLSKYLNSMNWYRIVNENKRNHFNKQKQRYYRLINKDKNNLKLKLTNSIKSKLTELKKGANFTPPKNDKKDANFSISICKPCTQLNNSYQL
tara:strand:- start:359152 stop:360150 length:999 start_codon:yes stop_codon:yes gene_type:complete